MEPILFFLFLIEIFKPVLSINEDSNSLILESFEIYFSIFFVLKIFTKFSACLTDNFFSIIFFARKVAFSNPINTFA